MRPTVDDNITDIVIDEFLLSEPMIYCTIVISTTGKLLFLDIGHGKAQLMHFFKWVGKEFVSKLRSIAMDMNCSFSEAVHDIQNTFPNLELVYDKFHIIQLYNREVITSIRKSQVDILSKEIAEATKNKKWDKVEVLTKARDSLKGQRMLLLANRLTLKAKDSRNKAINEFVKQQSIDGGSENYGVSHRREDFVERYENVLNANELIQNACRLREELQDILSMDDKSSASNELDKLIEELQQYGDPHFDKFAKTLTRRKDGIVSIANTKGHSALIENSD